MAKELSVARKGRRLRVLAAMIPSGFPCPPACGKCCESPIQMGRIEWDALARRPEVERIARSNAPGGEVLVLDRENGTVVISGTDHQCPFLDRVSRKCLIFDIRPMVCRVYGQHWTIRCCEQIECPPEAEIPDDVVFEWTAIVGTPMDALATPAWREACRAAVERWRKWLGRQDAMPGAGDSVFERLFTEEKTRRGIG